MENFVLVTGAFGGMGTKTTQILAKMGFKVLACDVRVESAQDENIIPVELDVTDNESFEKAKQKILSYTKTLYAIVNLAGIMKMGTLLDVDEKLFKKVMEVNFWGTFKTNRVFFDMLQQGSGRIINMSSEVAKYGGLPFNSIYGTSKIALDCYNDSLRRELTYLGIKVIKIRSGSFKTGLLKDSEKEYNQMIEQTKFYKQQLTTFKNFVFGELKKQNNPILMANLIAKILKVKKPKSTYSIKNSFKLKLLGLLNQPTQDFVFKKVVK